MGLIEELRNKLKDTSDEEFDRISKEVRESVGDKESPLAGDFIRQIKLTNELKEFVKYISDTDDSDVIDGYAYTLIQIFKSYTNS